MRPLVALVRHGETDANRAGLLVGRSDLELTAGGRDASLAVGRALAGSGATRLLASPLRRALDTAALIGEACDLDPEVDDRLVELDYGEWEGRSPRDLTAQQWAEWRADPDFRPPGGESLRDVLDRVCSLCDELLAQQGLVIAVSHVSPIKMAIAWALRAGPDLSWRMHLSLSSISRVGEQGGQPFVLSFNETGHLQS